MKHLTIREEVTLYIRGETRAITTFLGLLRRMECYYGYVYVFHLNLFCALSTVRGLISLEVTSNGESLDVNTRSFQLFSH